MNSTRLKLNLTLSQFFAFLLELEARNLSRHTLLRGTGLITQDVWTRYRFLFVFCAFFRPVNYLLLDVRFQLFLVFEHCRQITNFLSWLHVIIFWNIKISYNFFYVYHYYKYYQYKCYSRYIIITDLAF